MYLCDMPLYMYLYIMYNHQITIIVIAITSDINSIFVLEIFKTSSASYFETHQPLLPGYTAEHWELFLL